MNHSKSSAQSTASHDLKLRQLLIQERWPEMTMGCRACIRWNDEQRPECCGDCGIGERRRLNRIQAT
ncbi:MAG: hypothetical protein ACFCU9_01865 [Cyanophyceae cyanobacterium]